jgi:hypothetical protein
VGSTGRPNSSKFSFEKLPSSSSLFGSAVASFLLLADCSCMILVELMIVEFGLVI